MNRELIPEFPQRVSIFKNSVVFVFFFFFFLMFLSIGNVLFFLWGRDQLFTTINHKKAFQTRA